MRCLVIGGAGYIGAHFVYEARRQGIEPIVYDNLSRGHRASIPEGVPFVQADLLDAEALRTALETYDVDAIFHFAAFALVGESVSQPDLYYRNNTEGVRVLLDTMRATKSRASLIFSSTCAVFGEPERLPIAEDDLKRPISPYGRSKLMAEWLIDDYCRAYGLKGMALRYFNACGADASAEIGEDHEPETHLIPNILSSVMAGETLTIFGGDFPTADGTCVRDYVHVTDLAVAHIEAARVLLKRPAGSFDAIHLGTGVGRSNLELVAAAARVLGQEVSYKVGPRRAGDPPALYADNRKARQILQFQPQHSDLDTIFRTALAWHTSHPLGYES
jgi:UDP-glucose-4-epimerase GalE